MIARFCIQEKTSVSTAIPCSPEKFNEMLDSERVKNICARIAQATDDEQRSRLKRQLPGFCWHAQCFADDKRKAAGAVPSGLAMLDVDHVDNPRAWFESWYKTEYDAWLKEKRIGLIAVTPSTKGLRIVGEMQDEESIPEAQARMAKEFNIEAYDAVTKDLARLSFVTPREYVLYMDEQVLFFQEEEKTLSQPFPQRARSNYLMQNAECKMQNAECKMQNEGDRIQGGEEEGKSFHGIPYSHIVQQLMVSIGAGDGAEQGERNTVYFSLANYMRYICDFNADLLLEVLPDFGLSKEERLLAIRSSLGRPRRAMLPTTLQVVITMCEREATDVNKAILENKATDMPLPPLPPLLKIICRRLPEEFRPAMIIASLPVLGTLATRIRFSYLDRQIQSFSFFSCITAPAASGKSFIRKPIDLLLTPINEQDQIEHEKEQQYKEALRASKNSKNQPQDPHACPRNNGVAISIAKLLQLLTYAEGKHLIGIGEEMDTLVKSERAGAWSQKSDIYRLAFDNAEYGQAYMSDTSFSAHIAVYYNLLMTGTPNSMRRFFKDLENGLATRVCFAQLPDTSFTEIPVFAPYTEAERKEIIRQARLLDKEEGTISCPQVDKTIGEWLEQKRQQALDADSHAADTLRRRAAVIGFRAGMLCYLLEGRRWTKTVTAFAEWVAEYVFRNQMELWGDQMEQELTGSLEIINNERGAATSLLTMLDKEFSKADLIRLRAKNNQSVSPSSIKTLLSRWRANGRIEYLADGRYKKLV